MRVWISIVLASCAAVAISTVPRPASEARALDPTESRLRALTAEVWGTNTALQAARWVDSLSALAIRDAVDGLAIGFPAEGRSPEAETTWVGQVAARIAELGPRNENVVIGFYRQPSTHGAHPDVVGSRLTSATFAGTRDGTTYCLRIYQEVGSRSLRPDLGVCRLFARYGMAGPYVYDWLRAGNAGHARARNFDRPRASRTQRDPVFGINRTLRVSTYTPASTARCVAGSPEGCEASISEYGAWVGTYGSGEWDIAGGTVQAFQIAYGPRSWFLDWGAGIPSGGYFLSDLEREFGQEAFARFWTSPSPLPEAFEAAFGVGLGDWVVERVDLEYGVEKAGPGLGLGTLLLTLLALGAFAGGATLVQTGRRIA